MQSKFEFKKGSLLPRIGSHNFIPLNLHNQDGKRSQPNGFFLSLYCEYRVKALLLMQSVPPFTAMHKRNEK